MDKQRVTNLLESYVDRKIMLFLADHNLIPPQGGATISLLRQYCQEDLEAILLELEKLDSRD